MNNAPNAIGPYSQTRVVGNLVFCSGQIGIDPETGELKNGIEEQTLFRHNGSPALPG